MSKIDVVRQFEDEFKNNANHGIVDELMAPDFVHHAPSPGLPPGRAGMKAVGEFVVGAIDQIAITVDHLFSEGDLVADRITASGIRRDNGNEISWVENHIYEVRDGKITEWWPAGGPDLA